MNTRIVDPRTILAVLAMEAGLALPLMSLPAQGDRLPGLVGPLLLLALLPLGYLAVYEIAELRDPSWRLLAGIGLALATRGLVSSVPEPGLPGLAAWLGHSVVPMAIGVALWWRGGALGVAELTAGEVRTEFSLLAICLLIVIALIRPFLLPDPLLLGGAVGLFVAGGLIATALARQDAAAAAALRAGRALATLSALAPALAAVILVSILRPALIGSLWSAVVWVLQLVLTPLGWLFAWLASLFPPRTTGPLPPPPALPTSAPMPDPSSLGDMQDRLEWIGWVVLIALLLLATVAALVVVRLLLTNWIGTPTQRTLQRPVDLTVDSVGAPGNDAQDFLAWLMRWLHDRLGPGSRALRSAAGADQPTGDARAAYRNLLEWAERKGLGRRPAETTGQLRARLTAQAPETTETVDLVTSTYESDRYGQVQPSGDLLQRVQAAIKGLVARQH
jgi:hypothetical protein